MATVAPPAENRPLRLFVAIRPPDDVLRALAVGVEGALAECPGLDRLRRPLLEQWHITLAFYGAVRPERVESLSRRLGRVAMRTPPLQLRVAGSGGFPNRRNGKVLWLGVTATTTGELSGCESAIALSQPDNSREQPRDHSGKELARLAERCRAAGRREGLALSDERFRAHLTVGRSRERLDLTTAVDALQPIKSAVWTSPLELVSSRLGPTVEHQVIAAWPLGSQAGESHQA